MQALLDFAKGPLFRLTFIIMIFGLARIFVLDIWNAIEAYRNAGDKSLSWGEAIKKTSNWLFPVNHVAKSRLVYSLFSILFHVGLIVVPIFLLSHVQLWQESVGIGWITLPKLWVDVLTVTTIVFGLGLFIGRTASRNARYLSRTQDYLWPLILIIPFITGFVCANTGVSPLAYQIFMLIHILSGELIFVLIPFTKIAHCVILPISQFILTLTWKFTAKVDEKISSTLGKKGANV